MYEEDEETENEEFETEETDVDDEEEEVEEEESEDEEPSHDVDIDDMLMEVEDMTDDDDDEGDEDEDEGEEELDEDGNPIEDVDKMFEEGEEDESSEEEEDPRYSLVDLLDKEVGEEEDEEGIDSALDEVTDEDIVTAMHMSDTYKDWIDNAKKDEVEINDSFKALVARTGMDPKFLGENGIYNVEDFVPLVQGLKERSNEDAVVLPEEDDTDGWKNFFHEHAGVALKPEDFGEDVFKGTYLEDDPEKADSAREMGLGGALSPAQLRYVLEWMEAEQREIYEEQVQEAKDYNNEQYKILKEKYGEDYADLYKVNKREIMSKGKAFFEKFKDSKAFNSIEFWDFVTNMVNSGTKLGNYKFDDAKYAINNASKEKLEEMKAKILSHPHYKSSAKESNNSKIRKNYSKLHRRHAMVLQALEKK